MIGHISRPGYQLPVVPLIVTLLGCALSIFLGSLIGSSATVELITIALAVCLLSILAFVGDYWWAPMLLISALTFHTNLLGFMMTGLDIGVVVLAVLLPLKLAIRRLRAVQPRVPLGLHFWALAGYVLLHFVVICIYSRYQSAPGLKNIIKSYYSVISPLVFYGLLARYARQNTVRPVAIWTFAMYAAVVGISIPVVLMNVVTPFLSSRHFLFDWTHAGVALTALRNYSPVLFAVALAFWTSRRSVLVRSLLLLLGGLALTGALFSASRIATVTCLFEAGLWCVLRRRAWLMAPVIAAVALLVTIITTNPNVLYSLPTQVHRALTPFNLSEHQTEIHTAAAGSDQWHEDLRRDSYRYWTSDIMAFVFGHGFKGWDESLSFDPAWTRYYEDAKRLAVQTGRPENALNSITNIFGLCGVLLYGAFTWRIYRQLRSARAQTSGSSFSRSLCDFCLISLVTFVVFSPFAGGAPGLSIIYWQLGLLAQRSSPTSGRANDDDTT